MQAVSTHYSTAKAFARLGSFPSGSGHIQYSSAAFKPALMLSTIAVLTLVCFGSGLLIRSNSNEAMEMEAIKESARASAKILISAQPSLPINPDTKMTPKASVASVKPDAAVALTPASASRAPVAKVIIAVPVQQAVDRPTMVNQVSQAKQAKQVPPTQVVAAQKPSTPVRAVASNSNKAPSVTAASPERPESAVLSSIAKSTELITPPAPEIVAEARKNNKIEGVALNVIGLMSLTSGAVQLKNGSTIKIGQKFPTGEKLLAVDPDSSQIVTDKRTILVF